MPSSHDTNSNIFDHLISVVILQDASVKRTELIRKTQSTEDRCAKMNTIVNQAS